MTGIGPFPLSLRGSHFLEGAISQFRVPIPTSIHPQQNLRHIIIGTTTNNTLTRLTTVANSCSHDDDLSTRDETRDMTRNWKGPIPDEGARVVGLIPAHSRQEVVYKSEPCPRQRILVLFLLAYNSFNRLIRGLSRRSFTLSNRQPKHSFTMRTSTIVQFLLAGTAIVVPHHHAGDQAGRVKRAAAVTTNVAASADTTGQALATVSLVVANAKSGGRASSHVHRRDKDAMPAAPMPAEAPTPVYVQKRVTSVVAEAAGSATASIRPNHVKVGAGSSGAGVVVQIVPRDIEAEEELPVPNRVEERQIKSLTLSLNAASTATASAAPLGVAASGSGKATGLSTSNGGTVKRRTVEAPEVEGIMRTASGALSMALMNDVDLDLYKETIDTMKGYADTLEGVVRTYAEKAEAAGSLEAAVKAVNIDQLMTDLSVPLTQANDALYTGISRMMLSSARRPRRGGYQGLQNVVGTYDYTAELLALIVKLITLVTGLIDQIGQSGTVSTSSGNGGLDIINALLEGLLGGGSSGILSGSGLITTGSGTDGIINLVRSLMATVNGVLPIQGVTTDFTATLGL
ncbi:hypothetical protein V8F33_007737 [Rhypophila sp. PSN 637]